MKKRKTYEISVIDKTYSKIISDETKFYTSDTALELAFELKETEYNFESAEIVLLNVDDRSLATRPVSKINNDFVYEIDDDITTHYGDWRGQLMLVENGEVHVSSPIKFRIENDLYCNKPLEITEVFSWVGLKRYADSLVDELKQAVLSVDGLEDTFNANETTRQNTFETNESERDKTFNDNETARQTQELERENAETNRQSVFDENEAIRTETFNTNEATRIANEEARELSENERENAEAQRKIDHENRSAEMAGKANKNQEDWITPTLLNGVVVSGNQPPQYYKDEFGTVHFRGKVDAPVSFSTAFILPAGYRPKIDSKTPVSANNSFGIVRVSPTGLFTTPAVGALREIDISTVKFRAEG